MFRALLSLSCCAAIVSAAQAQNVIYQEGFENGLAGWTATGLWHVESATDFCAATVAPIPDGTQLAYFGTAQCNFNGGDPLRGPSGALEKLDWIDLPAATGSISLHFWSWSETEYCWGDWDVHEIVIFAENGPDAGFVAPYCDVQASPNLLPWHERRIDLSAYAGARVRFAFQFRANDTVNNHTRGWFVDDLSIVVEPGVRVCPDAGLTSNCPCSTAFEPVAGGCLNSTQQSATLFSDGVPSVSADTLSFRVAHLPPSASAILSQASGTASATPFGDGLRCVSGASLRMGATAASGGVANWPLSGELLSVRGQIPAAGGTRYYHVFYRDSLAYCTPAAFNVSDTQRIAWAP
jgi:hypothetical protein